MNYSKDGITVAPIIDESSEKERKVPRKNSCNLSPGSSLLSDGQRPYLG